MEVSPWVRDLSVESSTTRNSFNFSLADLPQWGPAVILQRLVVLKNGTNNTATKRPAGVEAQLPPYFRRVAVFVFESQSLFPLPSSIRFNPK